jgi:hypothetical protein
MSHSNNGRSVDPVASEQAPRPIGMDADQLRAFAELLAPILAQQLALVDSIARISPADVSRRRGKEMRKWRREQGDDVCSDPIEYQEADGESSWSKNQAAELLEISRRKKKQSKSFGR